VVNRSAGGLRPKSNFYRTRATSSRPTGEFRRVAINRTASNWTFDGGLTDFMLSAGSSIVVIDSTHGVIYGFDNQFTPEQLEQQQAEMAAARERDMQGSTAS
jgi:hypothetical protein